MRATAIAVAAIGIAASALTLVAAEVGLHVLREQDRFYPYHPNSMRVFYPSEEVTPGVGGTSTFSTNSLGTRGPERDGQRLGILTVGGSTTACTVLDDSEAWPQLLMDYLNEDAADPGFAWVTNSGIDGKNAHHHLMHARYLLPRMPDLDYVIYYAGLNDVGQWLYRESFDPDYLDDPENWERRVSESFRISDYTAPDAPAYKRLELWRRASLLRARVQTLWVRHQREDGAIVQDAQLRWMEEERAHRQAVAVAAVPRAKLETLPAALDSYAAQLREIVRLSREARVEPILMAQAMRAQFLSEAERRELWMGAVDRGRSYVQGEELLRLLGLFNDRMRDVAEQGGVAFIDLPALIAEEGESERIFYDGVHFNERGARVAARAVADHLEAEVLGR